MSTPYTDCPPDSRGRTKADWLLAHPFYFNWLRGLGALPSCTFVKHHRVVVICDMLRAVGIYQPQTMNLDILVAMRNAARKLPYVRLTPTTEAIGEIEVILARPGVDRAAILARINL